MSNWLRRIFMRPEESPQQEDIYRTAPQKPVDQPILSWHGGNGYYELQVFADGRGVYQVKSGGFGLPSTPPEPVLREVPPEKLKEIRELIETHAEELASLRPPMRNLIPEESTQMLEVHWEGLDLRVAMLSNDWSKYPSSKACAGALHLLVTELFR